MKKSLLLMWALLAGAASQPVHAQVPVVKKHATMQLVKKRAVGQSFLKVNAAETATRVNNTVFAGYYEASGSGVAGYENYYLLLSDKGDVSYSATDGMVKASNAQVVALDLYAPEGTGITLPSADFSAGTGTYFYDSDYSYVERYDANGNGDGGISMAGNVAVKRDEATGTYTVAFADANGVNYTFEGELSFSNMSSGSTNVYPQISTDIHTTFTGGLGYYYGNLMESQTGNLVLNLYDCDFDAETGGMQAKGHDLVINLFNRLFGDPKTATVIPGTYTVARNFKVNTFFPGMEVDYAGMTVVMGTYVKRRKAMAGLDSDYDYCYITDGTITISAGEKEGTFDFVIDCTTDRGHKVTGTARGISFAISDLSDSSEKDVDSNLTEDVELNFDRVDKARIYSLGEQNGVQVFTVDLGSPSGKDDPDGRGDQDLLRMEFQTPKGSAYLPEGTYTLMDESHLYTSLYAPFQLTRGYFDDKGGRTGTKYEHFRENPDPSTRLWWVVDQWATVYAGTVGVTKTDEAHYKFVINLFDGKGFRITGEYDKEMEYCYNPQDILSGISSAAEGWQSHMVEVYGLGGQLMRKVEAVQAQHALNGLPAGVYVVKDNGKTLKIVKR